MYRSFFKRFFDIVLSFCALTVLLPVILLVAVLVRLKLGGPVIFCQDRPGKDEKIFRLYKFRTMTDARDEQGELLPDAVRLTRFGKILRSTSLDELPQLWNILKGDMSIVGPRPERKVLLKEYQREIPEFYYRLKVKAGLTGYAQVYGKYNTTPYDKLKLDLYYIENYSVLLDIKLMFMTFRILFQKETSEGVEDRQVNALLNSAEKDDQTDLKEKDGGQL